MKTSTGSTAGNNALLEMTLNSLDSLSISPDSLSGVAEVIRCNLFSLNKVYSSIGEDRVCIAKGSYNRENHHLMMYYRCNAPLMAETMRAMIALKCSKLAFVVSSKWDDPNSQRRYYGIFTVNDYLDAQIIEGDLIITFDTGVHSLIRFN